MNKVHMLWVQQSGGTGSVRAGLRARARFGVVWLLALIALPAAALNIQNYYSPRNSERARRAQTAYIILHTTEGAKAGSLKKLHDRGEAHYFMDRAGKVYRIIDRNRVAFHCGRSMWDGVSNLDELAIGIEVEGYHDRELTEAQYAALRELLSQLQALYRIPDHRVLTHSMVAYGAPNRWHKRSHRGRKRCGMVFARIEVRRRLGLQSEPMEDPDVKAGRLVNADPLLSEVLYGDSRRRAQAVAEYRATEANVISSGRSAWDIARDRYNHEDTRYHFPDGSEKAGNEITNWNRIPVGTRISFRSQEDEPEEMAEAVKEIGVDGRTAAEIAGDEAAAATTIYFLPDGRIRSGSELTAQEIEGLPNKTRILVGYVNGGYITSKRRAFDVCGIKWNYPSTYYHVSSGQLVPGNQMNEGAIPRGTAVFFRN